MKKLNRKGFTLIELLAVIVIMAIILIVTVPNIIQSISDARVSSLHNLAVSAANTYNTAYAQDLLATSDDKKVLGKMPNSINNAWQCIGDITTTGKTLASVLGLTEKDVVLTANDQEVPREPFADNITSDFCSAIKINDTGKVEIILVAAVGGKFDVAGKVVYAYSEASAAVVK